MIIFFIAVSDFGIGTSIVRFVSREIEKGNKQKACSYFRYFFKIKIFLVFLSIILLGLFAKYFAVDLFGENVGTALFAGTIYILFLELTGILGSILASVNDFKKIFYRETLFQIFRFLIAHASVLLSIKYLWPSETKVAVVILALAISCFLSTLIIYFFSKKKISFIYKNKNKKLGKKAKIKANKFLISMEGVSLSSLFFGEVDILILGYFIVSMFVGYYRASLGIVAGIIGLLTFSSALLPVFSRLSSSRIKKDFRKFFYIVLSASLIAVIIMFIFSSNIVSIIYGKNYLLASGVLKAFSLIIILSPLISLYETYFISRGKPQIVTKILIVSTVLNVILTIALISWLLGFGEIYGVYGAIIASTASKLFAFVWMVLKKR